MRTKLTIKILGILIIIFGVSFACQQSNDDSKQTVTLPNIVLIFTDDQSFNTIRSLGNQEIYTPNLDRLVQNGTTFTHAYNMGGWNGAICVASRTMINSGRFIWRAQKQVDSWRQKDSVALQQTWSNLMNQSGYDTYMSGKWHVNAPASQIFDQVSHIRPGMPRDAGFGKAFRMIRAAEGKALNFDTIMPIGYNRPKDENDHSWSPSDTSFGGFWQGGKHWSEVLADDAINFIQQAQRSDDPFFMYLASNAPHDPRQSPQEFVDRYPLDKISMPASFQPLYPDLDSIGVGPSLRDEALAPFPRTPYAVKTHIQEYYAIITHLDVQIGKILDALEASGKLDNTYVFLTSDHGLAVGRHGLLGKQNMYDHSVRVPLIMMGPDIPKNKKVTEDVYLQDIMATSLELAQITKPEYVEFNSFYSLALGKQVKGHYDEIFGCYTNDQRMIRKNGYKLIAYPRANKMLLFNLKEDPHEINNLAEDPGQANRVKELFGSLLKLMEEMDDQLDLTSMYDNLSS